MTEAELEALCRRENIPLEQARDALELVETLREPHPRGINMPGDKVGAVMDAAAGLANTLYDNLSIGAPYFAAAEEVVKLMRRLGAPKEN
jgi:hypothetical protein